ncbi:MAG: hypothetical protein GX589_07640 [Deltaproteobacteria bacterium]|nr:hypothetical protein [Deltaproteobacteria bacterium]
MITTRKAAYCLLCMIVYIFYAATPLLAYPVRDYERTGIRRLEGFYLSLTTPSGQIVMVPGARLEPDQIKLHLKGRSFPLPAPDPEFSRQLRETLGGGNFGVALLDITDPNRPLYAAHGDQRTFVPSSVGKILVSLAMLQTLAEIYPRDIPAREKVLRDTIISADEFIISDEHEVPFWDEEKRQVYHRLIELGDRANLWTYLDWMMSASSNAAGSSVMKQILLLNHFRKSYPPSPAAEEAFFRDYPPQRLASMWTSIMRNTMLQNGFSPERLSQGSFFTRIGRQRVPSRGSTASPRELVRFLMLLEQGRLIDEFSSLEMKRLMYMTQKRARYAASPSLVGAAVYYKAGSQYRCGGAGECGQYFGNTQNLMNVAAIVEYPAQKPRLIYLVSVTSNVLRYDSSELHTQIAGLIQNMMERRIR